MRRPPSWRQFLPRTKKWCACRLWKKGLREAADDGRKTNSAGRKTPAVKLKIKAHIRILKAPASALYNRACSAYFKRRFRRGYARVHKFRVRQFKVEFAELKLYNRACGGLYLGGRGQSDCVVYRKYAVAEGGAEHSGNYAVAGVFAYPKPFAEPAR